MVILGRKNIKELVGTVVSAKMENTLVVSVRRVKVHPLYKKRFVVKKKYYVHNEIPEVKMDSVVKIRETKPISKLKKRLCVELIQN